jgi:MFS transporter, DHA1 family, staphyloferrin A biosynthesis exporter
LTDQASMFEALRHRDFRWLWGGTFCSTAGQWIQTATLGWVAYDLTGSGTLLCAVLGIRAIPMLLFAPLAGMVADRYNRRRALVISQTIMVVATFMLTTVIALEWLHIWHLFAFTLCVGASGTFDRTLRNTLVFDVVPRENISNAVALNTIAFSTSRAVGPALAGLLIAWVGSAWNFAIQGFLYLGAMASVLMVTVPQQTKDGKPRGSAWGDMRAGLRFAVTNPVARMMLLLGLVPPLLLIPSFSALMPVFAVKVFHTGPEGLGLLLSTVGIGGILGGALAASASRYDRVGLLQTGAMLGFALALVGFALSPGIAVALGFLIVAGAGEMVLATSNVTTLQMCAPRDMRGRIASLLTIFPASISIGAITSGMGADLLGPQELVIVLAAVAACIAIASWSGTTTVRDLRLSKLVAGGEAEALPSGKHLG